MTLSFDDEAVGVTGCERALFLSFFLHILSLNFNPCNFCWDDFLLFFCDNFINHDVLHRTFMLFYDILTFWFLFQLLGYFLSPFFHPLWTLDNTYSVENTNDFHYFFSTISLTKNGPFYLKFNQRVTKQTSRLSSSIKNTYLICIQWCWEKWWMLILRCH